MTGENTYAVDFPYRFSGDGKTATTDHTGHMRDLVEQLLFTRVGERLTRPTLGCGLPDLLFGPLGPDTATAAEMTIQVAIQEHLSRQIELTALDVQVQGAALVINLTYRIIETGAEVRQSLTAEAGVAP